MNTGDRRILERDLCARLPYGVKIISGLKLGDKSIVELTISDFPSLRHRKVFKPIYHPMSDLTKEITHKGETFVPMEKIAKLCFPEWNWLDCRKAEAKETSEVIMFDFDFPYVAEYSLVYHKGFNSFSALCGFSDEWIPQPQLIFDWLNEHHFNWRNLPAHLWVDVNTLDQPCY